MSKKIIDSLVKEIDDYLGYRTFYSLRDLTNIGYYGSMAAARRAMKEGHLSFVKVSQRRCVIPRKSLLDYLSKNLSEHLNKQEDKSDTLQT